MAAYGQERGGPLAANDVARIVSWIRSRGPANAPIPSRNLGDANRGAPIYAANCERCHGTVKARSSAVHLANTRFLEGASDAFIGWAVLQGRPGTPMESWKGKLSDGQIDDVVAYVRSFAKPSTPDTLPPPTGKEPVVLNPRGQSANFSPRSTPCPPSAPCTPDMRFVSIDQVKQAFEAKRRMVIIDARPASDWMRSHIPGAVSIPYHDLKRLDEVPNDGTWVIAYCACPHHLSGDVVDALRKRGVSHAVVLDEGILEWHRRGYPMVVTPGVEPPPALVITK
jgi:rhodanese-related sulfurtransferase/mono/diheme cytochrome c family protein